MFCDGESCAGVNTMIGNFDSIDFDSVGALHVQNIPIPVRQDQTAMLTGNIAKTKDNIAIVLSSDENFTFAQRNRVAASCWN